MRNQQAAASLPQHSAAVLPCTGPASSLAATRQRTLKLLEHGRQVGGQLVVLDGHDRQAVCLARLEALGRIDAALVEDGREGVREELCHGGHAALERDLILGGLRRGRHGAAVCRPAGESGCWQAVQTAGREGRAGSSGLSESAGERRRRRRRWRQLRQVAALPSGDQSL